MSLDDIDAARCGPFRVIYRGDRYQLDGPARLPWQLVLAHIDLERAPIDLVWEDDLNILQLRAIGRAWARHFGLPSIQQAQRLAYLVDHYHDELEYELQRIHRIDLDQEWRARRWRRLLSLTDRLPRNTHYSAAVANDPEHAELLAKAMADAKARGEDSDEPTGPPIQDWSPEVAELVVVGEKIDRLTYVTQMIAANGKGVAKPEPAPRPVTELARATRRAERNRRQAAHEALAARLLPHKYPKAE